jgi:hypothetical protein
MSARSNFQLTFSISSQSECQAAVFLLAGVLLFALSPTLFLSRHVFSGFVRAEGCIPEHLARRRILYSYSFCDAVGISFAEISEM